MNNVAFIATMLPLGVLMAAVAVITLKTRVLPRWLGWLTAITAPLLLVNGMFRDAEFGPAFLLFLLWTLLASSSSPCGGAASRRSRTGRAGSLTAGIPVIRTRNSSGTLTL
jgi:hypothetical protein